ncbi:cache domain-containing sensor histidine kinase [Paenibacillus contaminans]|uniref:histidine kinase n=1 Tax=Paenibacillus contaminans TaxID=450362 RepID=A0A329MRB2_9BACL|nr:sensor histidine kinase [Paenibacillus contaminans]RAV22092.1 sensor histidine kinase [Paenibacillus contaminans]
MAFLQRLLFGMKLQNKLIITYLAIAILPLALLGAFSYQRSSKVVLDKVCQTVLENLSQVNYSLAYFVKDIEQLSMYVYGNREIQEVLAKDRSRPLAEKYQDDKRINQLLDSFLGFKKWDINLYVLGENGDRYLTGELLPNQYDEYNVNWGLFRKAQLAGGGVVWDTHYSMKKTDDFGIVLSSGQMLKTIETGKPLGYFVIDIMESALADKYNKAQIVPGGQVFLLDRNGYIVSGIPSKRQVGTKLTEPYVERVLEGRKGYFTQRDGFSSPHMVIFDTSEATGFKLVSIVPVTALTKESAGIRDLTVLIIAAGIVISCWLAYKLSVNITNPLRKLRSLMSRVEDGNLNVSFASKHDDEIGQLGRSFNAMLQQIKLLIDEVYKKQLMLQEAEIKAIHAQFNPHFLYNALDSINWMARLHKLDDISRTAVSLGELLRFSIRKGNHFIPIGEDMQQIHNYLVIQKMRYRDKFEVFVDIDPEMEKLYTLKLLLQPLVENAITHGLETKRGKGKLNITGRKLEDRVRFVISDDGTGMPPEVLQSMKLGRYSASSERTTGLGLENLQKRLQLYFGKNFLFEINSEQGRGTTISLEIPALTQADAMTRESGAAEAADQEESGTRETRDSSRPQKTEKNGLPEVKGDV